MNDTIVIILAVVIFTSLMFVVKRSFAKADRTWRAQESNATKSDIAKDKAARRDWTGVDF